MDEFTGSRFYLLCRGMLCAVRVVGLLCTVTQFFHKLLNHLALNSGCDLMFWWLVLWTVISFSDVWNGDHLHIFGFYLLEKENVIKYKLR